MTTTSPTIASRIGLPESRADTLHIAGGGENARKVSSYALQSAITTPEEEGQEGTGRRPKAGEATEIALRACPHPQLLVPPSTPATSQRLAARHSRSHLQMVSVLSTMNFKRIRSSLRRCAKLDFLQTFMAARQNHHPQRRHWLNNGGTCLPNYPPTYLSTYLPTDLRYLSIYLPISGGTFPPIHC